MSYCTISCRCGHQATFEEFTSTPVGGDLPRGHYQCPACHFAWRVDNREGEARRSPVTGFVYVPPSRLVGVDPAL